MSDSSPDLEIDLATLRSRAFGVADWAGPILERYHAAKARFGRKDRARFEKAREWLVVPLSLWPFSMAELLEACLDTCAKTKNLSDCQRLVIDLLPAPPDDAIRAVAAENELQIQAGSYSEFIKKGVKYQQVEADLKADPLFQKQWQTIKRAFDVAAKADYKGVLRRTMVTERNLRPDWSIHFDDENAIFEAVFDAFCLRWNLYGMQHDEPLLLKLAVHLTPHGTMMHIPAYWSLDPMRDLNWSAIRALHRARAPHRQGETIAANKADRKMQAAKLRLLDAEAKRRDLHGDAKHHFLCDGLGLVHQTSTKRLQRLRKEFPA